MSSTTSKPRYPKGPKHLRWKAAALLEEKEKKEAAKKEKKAAEEKKIPKEMEEDLLFKQNRK